jgi:hypothetical protein
LISILVSSLSLSSSSLIRREIACMTPMSMGRGDE